MNLEYILKNLDKSPFTKGVQVVMLSSLLGFIDKTEEIKRSTYGYLYTNSTIRFIEIPSSIMIDDVMLNDTGIIRQSNSALVERDQLFQIKSEWLCGGIRETDSDVILSFVHELYKTLSPYDKELDLYPIAVYVSKRKHTTADAVIAIRQAINDLIMLQNYK